MEDGILVERLLQYGISRQYQVFAEFFSHDSIFCDSDEGLQWLLNDNGPPTLHLP